MQILVISGCTKSKSFDGGFGESMLDEYSREKLLKQDPERVLPARGMYTGDGHKRVRDAVSHLQMIEGVDVDWSIVSAGYGTVDADTKIAPYDCTLSNVENKKLDYQQRAERLGIANREQTIDDLIRAIGRAKQIPDRILQYGFSQYDLCFVLLGREYLLATEKALQQCPSSVSAYAFVPDSMQDLIGSFTPIPANEQERNQIDTVTMSQKEAQLKTLVSHCETQDDLQSLVRNPERVHSLSMTPPEQA